MGKIKGVKNPITVWRVCGVDGRDRLTTILYDWKGSRVLPMKVWLKAENFDLYINGNRHQACGFHAYLDEAACQTYFDGYEREGEIALVKCRAKGVHLKEGDVYYCDQLSVQSVVQTRIVA